MPDPVLRALQVSFNSHNYHLEVNYHPLPFREIGTKDETGTQPARLSTQTSTQGIWYQSSTSQLLCCRAST